MAQNPGINLPSGFGGLVNYKEEYESKFMLKPTHVIVFIVLVVLFRFALPIFFS